MLTGIIERVKAAKIDLNCLNREDRFDTQYEVAGHLEKALQLLENAIVPVRVSLSTNGRDNPSCPMCRHYNAMLVEFSNSPDVGPGEYLSVCRDCGFKVIGERIYKSIAGVKERD